MERQTNKYSFLNYISDVFYYVKPYKRQFFWGIVIRLTSDISRLYPIWALSRIVVILSKPISSDIQNELIRIFIFWGITAFYYSIAHNISKYLGYQVAEKASLDIYKSTLAHIFRLDFAWQEKENSGNKMKRIDKGLDGMNNTIRRIFDVLIEVMVNLVGTVAIFFTLEKTLSYALILFIISYFIIGTYLLKRAVRQERIVNKASEDLGGLTFESLNNIQTIKSLAIDGGVVSLVGRNIRKLVKRIKRRIFLFRLQSGVLLFYEIGFQYIVTAILVFGVLHGRFDIGLPVLFIGLFQRVSTSADEMTDVTQQLVLSKIWISRAKELLEIEPKIECPDKVKYQYPYQSNWKVININNVRFSYKRNRALQDVTFNVNRGEKVGIVGLSGAGKSTLFKLFLDLYENYQGDIFLDDIPLKKMQRQSFISHVAVVLQDTELFDMSLKDNIEIATVKKNLDPKLLGEVITMAHLDDVVEGLPNGVFTIVGEKGIKLSGGQRQRVGIARALYRQPDILLLDEATSNLDAHSEKEIQKAILESVNKFTTIVIAHRLSTIKVMDKIIVLEGGKVIEEGNFENLLAKDGAFARMWRDQKI